MNRNIMIKLAYAAIFFVIFWLLQTYTPMGHYFSLTFLQQKSELFKELVKQNYAMAVTFYLAIFITTIAFSLPTSIVLTLLGGYIFGTIAGALYATIAVTIGVSIAYVSYRLFFSDMLQQLYAERAAKFEKTMQESGVSYLLMLHFSTIFPYFVINAVAALSRVPVFTVVWTAAVGFIPQAFVYAYAGQEFASIENVSGIFSTEVTIAFILLILLACVPIVLKKYQKKIEL